jgi:hypothetical protein
MGWLTTGRGETLRDKAKNAAKNKVSDAVDAVNPVKQGRKVRNNRAEAKGKNICPVCDKPCPKGGNVHKKCAGQMASGWKHIHDVEG